MKTGVEGGELVILQDSFLLGSGALDTTENTLELNSHGGKEGNKRKQQSGLRRSPNQNIPGQGMGLGVVVWPPLGGKRLRGNPNGLSPLISAKTCPEKSSR